MKGEATPLVLIPRYTTYVGDGTFTTVPLNVSEYATAYLTLWRGKILRPGTPYFSSFNAHFEESHDAVEWGDPIASKSGAEATDSFGITFSTRWFRVRIVLGISGGYHNTGIVCWSTGLLNRRIEN